MYDYAGGFMRLLGLIFLIIVIGLVGGFMWLNRQPTVVVDVFGYHLYDIPLSMVAFYAFMVGMVFVIIFALVDEIVLRSTIHRLRRENRHLRKELNSLRNMPLEEEK